MFSSSTDIKNKLTKIVENIKLVYEAGVKDAAVIYYLPVNTSYVSANNVNKAISELNDKQNTSLTRSDIFAASINAGNSGINIGNGAFEGFVNLTVIIPLHRAANRLSIGANAFKDCKLLKQLDLRRCSDVGDGFISGCESLKNVWLSTNTSLSRNSFDGICDVTLKEREEVKEDGSFHKVSFVGTEDGKPVYVHSITSDKPSNESAIPPTTKLLRYVGGNVKNIQLPENCEYALGFLKDNPTPNRLHIYNLNDLYISQCIDENYDYTKNKLLQVEEDIYIGNSHLRRNALHNIAVKNLTLYHCSLISNSCFSIDVDNLVLDRLVQVNSTSFRSAIIKNFSLSNTTNYCTDGDRGLVRVDTDSLITVLRHSQLRTYELRPSRIAGDALRDLNILHTITIGEDVQEIEAPFARGCKSLHHIIAPFDNFKIEKYSLYTKDCKTLIRFIPYYDYVNTTVHISENCERVAEAAFEGCSFQNTSDDTIYDRYPTIFNIPDNVTSIADNAFEKAKFDIIELPDKFKEQCETTDCFGAADYLQITFYKES